MRVSTKSLSSGKSALPDWLKISAQRFVLLGLTGAALMLTRQDFFIFLNMRTVTLFGSSTVLTILVARLHIMGATLPVFTRFDNPAAVAETPIKQLTQHYLVTINWWLLLAPGDQNIWKTTSQVNTLFTSTFSAELCCDWTMSSVPLVQSLSDPRNLATISLYLLLGHLAYRALSASSQHESSVIALRFDFFALNVVFCSYPSPSCQPN